MKLLVMYIYKIVNNEFIKCDNNQSQVGEAVGMEKYTTKVNI